MSYPTQLFNLSVGDTFTFLHNDTDKVFSVLSISDSGEILVEQVHPHRAQPQFANLYAWVRQTDIPRQGDYFLC